MSNGTEAEYEIAHGRPQAFYENFERKGELQHQTHYCPGLRARHRAQDAGAGHR